MNQIHMQKQVEQNFTNDSEIFEDCSSDIDESTDKTQQKRQSRLSQITTTSEFSGANQEYQSLFGNRLEINNLKKTTQAESKYTVNGASTEIMCMKELVNKKTGKRCIPMQADAFLHLERLLFDLVGFKHAPINTASVVNPIPVVAPTSTINNANSATAGVTYEQLLRDLEVKKLNEFLNNEAETVFLSDMYLVNEMYDMSETGVLTKKNDSKKENNSKLITIVMNHALRPRKALRMIIHRKSQINLDSMLNEISVNFKMDYSFVKKLFNLHGKEVNVKIKRRL